MNVIQLRAPLQLQASTPGALPSRFEGTANSGAFVHSHGVIIDLATTTADAPMPLLHEHNRLIILGVVTEATFVSGQLEVSGKLFSDIPNSTAEELAQLSLRGVPLQFSVGLFGYTEQTIFEGQQVTVNSRTVVGPATVLRRGTVREVSIVALGADPQANARLFGSGARQPVTLSATAILARRARQAAGLEP